MPIWMISIAVFSKEHPPKHATILKRGNHEIQLGRFKITPNIPKSHLDIKEVKEEIDPKYKRQIAAWSGKKNAHIKGYTNWAALDVEWNILNNKVIVYPPIRSILFIPYPTSRSTPQGL
jgi:hypothetical protein